MHIPVVSAYANAQYASLNAILGRRSPVPDPKGGGGHGGGHGGGRSGGGRSGGGGKGSSPSAAPGSRGASVPVSGSLAPGKTSATSYGPGSTKVETIPGGQPFAGRSVGGGTREQVYGTPYYGSGYPATNGLGVSNRGFPYYYYPFAWGPGYGYGPPYYHTSEYGKPENSSRPGGAEMQAAFSSRSSNTTFHILSDNSTIVALIASINLNCTALLNANSSHAPTPFTGAPTDPRFEQAVQYYRASSVALTLDGYNNTVALNVTDGANAPPTPVTLPPGVDRGLLDCLNATIGESVPLFDSGYGLGAPNVVGVMMIPCVLMYLLALL